MEHIPQPANPIQPMRIPYLNGPAYDGLGFSGFPERVRWDPDKLVFRGTSGAYDTAGAPGFLQEWFWFGMLSECLGVCGVRVRRDDFLREERDSDGNIAGIFITTTKLYAYLERFRDSATQFDEMAQIEAVSTISACLDAVDDYLKSSYVLDTLVERYRKQDPGLKAEVVESFKSGICENPLTPEIQLSVEALKTTLGICLPQFLAKTSLITRLVDQNVNCMFLAEQAIRQGWCPNLTATIQKTSGNVVLYYATLLGPPAAMANDHRACRENMCTALNVTRGAYRRLHVCDSGNCEDFEPSQEEIGSIIDAGGVPLISVELKTDSQPQDLADLRVGVSRYEPGLVYTCISHVWADGLGNPDKNAIPLCQLLRLRKLIVSIPSSTESPFGKQIADRAPVDISEFVARLDPSTQSHLRELFPDAPSLAQSPQFCGIIDGLVASWVQETVGERLHFWLDTLCVPVRSMTRRKATIGSMSHIYSQASHVLVLDLSLTQHPGPSTMVETLMRILLSSWNRRLWTLQEGVVAAKRLWTQFADGAINLSSYSGEMNEYNKTIESKNAVNAAITQMYLSYFHLHLQDKKNAFFRIAHATRTRSTSDASDEAVCLASLLGHDMAHVVAAPADQRMQALFLARKEVCKHLVFITGAKLLTPGFRWAPASFLTPRTEAELQSVLVEWPEELATVTKHGLLARFEAFELELTKKPIGNKLWILVATCNQLYRASVLDPEVLRGIRPSSKLCVLLRNRTVNGILSDEPSGALLAECKRGNDGVVEGTFVCLIRLALVRLERAALNWTEHSLREEWQRYEKAGNKVDDEIYATHATAELTGPDQQWLIS